MSPFDLGRLFKGRPPHRYHVTMSSDLYGSENFNYETYDEALAGLLRLVQSAQEHAGVDREFTLTIDEEADDETDD